MDACMGMFATLTLPAVVSGLYAVIGRLPSAAEDNTFPGFLPITSVQQMQLAIVYCYTLCSKKTCDHIFDDKLK